MRVTKQKRLENIDICKGILILLIIIQHGIQMTAAKEGYFRTWDGSVSMPAFFILSGILYNHEKWSQEGFIAFAIRRIQTLIIPYFFFELTGSAIVKILLGKWYGLNVSGILSESLHLMKNALTLHCSMAPIWFLPTLFIAELLLYISLVLEKHNRLILHSCIIGAILASLYYVHFDIQSGFLNGLMWRGTRILIGFVFLVIGEKGKHFFLLNDYKIKQIIIAFAIPSLVVLFNGRCSMYAMNYRSLLLFIISGCAGMFFLLAISSMIHNKAIAYVGNGSLILLGTHSIVYVYFYSRAGYVWPYPWSTFIIYLVIVSVVAVVSLKFYPIIFPHMTGKQLIWDYHRK